MRLKWLPAVVLLLPAVLTPASSTASRVVAIELGGTITHATFELVRRASSTRRASAQALSCSCSTPPAVFGTRHSA